MTSTSKDQQGEKKENLFVNLGFNIVAPVLILSKFSGEDALGPLYGLLVALAFPLGYGLYDLIKEKRKNILSLIGFISILLTGIIGVLQIPAEWLAIKEAFVPFLIGIIILISIWTPYPLVKKIIYNEKLLNVNRINSELKERNNKPAFEKVLFKASVFLSCSFFLSSILNYVLAKVLVNSNPGTTAFNEELGQMTMLSYPIIALPSTGILLLIFWYLMKSIKKLTGLQSDDIYAEALKSR